MIACLPDLSFLGSTRKVPGTPRVLPRPPEKTWTGDSWKRERYSWVPSGGSWLQRRKANVQQSFQSPSERDSGAKWYQGGYRTWMTPSVGLCSSLWEKLKFLAWKRIMGVAESWKCPRDLCKGPRVAKQADGREVASWPEKCLLPRGWWIAFTLGTSRQWHQRSDWIAYPTLPLSLSWKHISHQTKGAEWRAPLIASVVPTTSTDPPRVEDLHTPYLLQHPHRQGDYHQILESKLRGKNRDTHSCFL